MMQAVSNANHTHSASLGWRCKCGTPSLYQIKVNEVSMAALGGKERARYVREMFGRIAPRYDLMNRVMTLGQDRIWRRYVIRQAALPTAGKLLDVATGTGDIALEGVAQQPALDVVGADFSVEMMKVGRSRPHGHRVGWVDADALSLPFADSSFDAVTSGYLMRNVIDIPAAFREQWRVVRPGGWVVCLDTSPPPRGLLYPLIVFYLRAIIPLIGLLLTGERQAYAYLPESTERFKTPAELAALMATAGFADVTYRTFVFGTMAVHTGRKSGDAPRRG